MDSYQYLVELFESQPERVFYGRQIEVFFEQEHFHWKTNRGLRFLAKNNKIGFEKREIKGGRHMSLYWNKGYRYYRRGAKKVIELVETFSEVNYSAGIGSQAELLFVEAFARYQYTLVGRNINEYAGVKWTKTGHDLDMIVTKDGHGYGIEIKNTLGYIEKEELDIKIELCEYLGIRPIIINRFMPKTYAHDIIQAGGYAMYVKYQLYPPYFKDLAKELRDVLDFPVDTPKAIYDGTMDRLEKWRIKHI